MTKAEDEKRLEQLEILIDELEIDSNRARYELSMNDDLQKDCRKELKQIKERLENPPTISDEALLQYVKFRSGVDVEKFRREIMSEGVMEKIENGAVNVKANGCKLVIQDKTIVEIKT